MSARGHAFDGDSVIAEVLPREQWIPVGESMPKKEGGRGRNNGNNADGKGNQRNVTTCCIVFL
jgi:hypothetical protein